MLRSRDQAARGRPITMARNKRTTTWRAIARMRSSPASITAITRHALTACAISGRHGAASAGPRDTRSSILERRSEPGLRREARQLTRARPGSTNALTCPSGAATADGVAADMGKQVVAAEVDLDLGSVFDEVPQPARRFGRILTESPAADPASLGVQQGICFSVSASCL